METPLTPEDAAQSISRALVIDPRLAIAVHKSLVESPRETVMSEDEWIAGNRKLLAKLGDEAYLRLLLDVLKGVDPVATHRLELTDMVDMYFGPSHDEL